jgi:Spy/CpxP family protein refolding chaperone
MAQGVVPGAEGELDMFGLIVGTLCLFALMATLRARRYAHYGSLGYWRHGYAYAGCAHHDASPYYGGHRDRRRLAMRWLFERLDTTPGQEKAIVKSLETCREHLASGRGELGDARKDLAQALGGDVLDQSALAAAVGRVDTLVERAGVEFSTALSEVHAALDGKQRKQLAELIAEFPTHGFRHGRC